MLATAERQETKVLSFSCPPELSGRVAAVCGATGRTEIGLFSEALERYLRELEEDIEDARIAEAALDEFEASGKELVPAEEVYARLGL